VSASYARRSLEGIDLRWEAEDSVLTLEVEDDLSDDIAGVVLFHESFDATFGAAREVRTLQTDFEGHHVVIYIEGLGAAFGCDTALHQRSDYELAVGGSAWRNAAFRDHDAALAT
jgi:hypothetical protein